MLKLNIPEIVFPILGSGALFIAVFLFSYIYEIWRKKLYFGMLIISIITFIFVSCEAGVILTGGYLHRIDVSRDFFRIEQITGAYYLFGLPYFITHLLQIKGRFKRINMAIALTGLGVAVIITVIAFTIPDLFVSMKSFSDQALRSEGAFGRGKQGPVYLLRDIILAVFILYAFIVMIVYLPRLFRLDRESAGDAFVVLVGLGIAIFGAVDDTTPLYFNRHIGLLRDLEYGRFILGLIFFTLFSIIALSRRFIVQAREVEQAFIQLNNSEERFKEIADNINEVFWLFQPAGEAGQPKLLYVNRAYRRLWERNPAVLYQQPDDWIQSVHEEDREMVRKETMLPRDGREAKFDFRIIRSDGSVSWIRDTIVPVKDGTQKTVRYARISSDITQKKLAENELVFFAFHDQLTGLLNRKSLFEKFSDLIVHSSRTKSNESRALLFIDIDNFKDINDSLGHSSGDEILRIVSQRLSGTIRKSDLLFRLGNDEFTAVLNPVKIDTDPAIVAEKILNTVSSPITVNSHALYLTCSIGISIFPADGETIEVLLRNADAALFEAKKIRNVYRFYTEDLQNRAAEKIRLAALLRKGIENREFLLYYQPQVDFTGKVTGAEALIRWRNQELGFVMPSAFIPVAEETGLIQPIGTWVLEQACRDSSMWRERGLGDVSVAANLSVQQFKDRELIPVIKGLLSNFRISPGLFHLEITESVIMENLKEAGDIMAELSGLNIRFSIDDFGTGYSSLQYLNSLPVHMLKVDRSFITGIPVDPRQNSLLKAIVSMAESLDMEVMVEGVETEQQLEYCRSLTFQGGIQGYIYSKPLPLEEFISFTLKQNGRRPGR